MIRDAELERHYIGKHAVNYWRGANMKMIEVSLRCGVL